MTYYVNLGGILLYGIKNVEDNSEREITSYDGIGQGFFPVPESRKLRTWTFECEMTEQNRNRLANWTAASKVFTGFEVLLATKDPSRFIFVSNNRNESMSGYLTGYSKKEEYPGIYNVTVKVTEYKAAGVKTTDVPYIKRPGKAPAIPKVVVFDSKTTPYSLIRRTGKDEESSGGGGISGGGGGCGGSGASRSSGFFGFLDGLGEKVNQFYKDSLVIKDRTNGAFKVNPATLNDGQDSSYIIAMDTIKNKEQILKGINSAANTAATIGKAMDNYAKSIPDGAIGGNN
ncbi:hypothetical protein [Clostridium merdae]|uniref:hypothetical protein n=1 Tax=Clostridium merdae TaxID=1958780 RepID=UPI00164CF9A4|nr:hypothetical protein [Clostridium merdae]